jgi:hypothetical protein
MRLKQNRALILLAALLLAAGYGVYRTGSRAAPPSARSARTVPSDRTIVVDQSSLLTAEQLVRMPTTGDERPFAEDALRIADNEMDLAFAQAVRRTLNRPRATTAEAKEADARLQQSLRALSADQARLAAITALLAKANAADAESLNDRLNLVKAQAALDQDEVDDSRQDLRRAGGDPQGMMQDVLEEHDAASKSSDSVRVVVTNPAEARGLLRGLQVLQAMYGKESLLRRAKSAADSLAQAFRQRHDSLEARASALVRDSSNTRLSHDSSASLLEATRRRALIGKIRTTLDQRVENQNGLSAAYAGWISVLGSQERAAINTALREVALVLAIVLGAMLLDRWIKHAIGAKAMDRRRTQTLFMVTRVSLQVAAVLLILLVIFGPPDNLGTIVGLAGAGLTVALKDFVLGFIGWFVLMGRNGVRIGDLVEINGVTGEVVELGMFYTTLLETGDWTESGHPTGRRVTFTNGFAIEGHYFNFSTSGRWLWDDLRIVVPAGHDPYPIAEALKKQVEEATAASTREAEAQWKEAWHSPHLAAPPPGASATLRPVAGGVEITIRYITRATDREGLRSALYRTALDMLGGAKSAAPAHID